MKPSFFFRQITLLFLSLLVSSCHGQTKGSPSKKSNAEPNPVSIWQKDQSTLIVDPYFVETKTINAPFGPQSITRNMVQDKNGNLWLASWEGIIRYDGKNFTQFSKDFIGFLYEDKKGSIWFSAGTPQPRKMALYRYDGRSGPRLGDPYFNKIIVGDGQIFGILEARDGSIWFGTEVGVCRYDGKTFKYFKE